MHNHQVTNTVYWVVTQIDSPFHYCRYWDTICLAINAKPKEHEEQL